mgnify:CR=1 FL=1
MVKIGNDWDRVLDGEFDKEYYLKLREFLKEEYKRLLLMVNDGKDFLSR